MLRELDPVGYDEQERKFNNASSFPSFFLIRREMCEIFDTNTRVAKSKPPPYKHITRPCADPNCKFKLYETVDGHVHKISHV